MTDLSPNGTLDRLAQDINIIKTEIAKIQKRLEAQDAFTFKILSTIKLTEETFDLRVARAQYNLYSGLAHSIEHSIEDFTERLQAQRRGFEVHVVDGKSVLENGDTIRVTKRPDSGYDYSPASQPDEINNTGTEALSKYFDEDPSVFGDRDVILINVLTKEPLPEKVYG